MSEKWKNIITLSLLSAFLLGFGAWAAAKPADELSLSERLSLIHIFGGAVGIAVLAAGGEGQGQHQSQCQRDGFLH